MEILKVKCWSGATSGDFNLSRSKLQCHRIHLHYKFPQIEENFNQMKTKTKKIAICLFVTNNYTTSPFIESDWWLPFFKGVLLKQWLFDNDDNKHNNIKNNVCYNNQSNNNKVWYRFQESFQFAGWQVCIVWHRGIKLPTTWNLSNRQLHEK